ncbi:MAG TPA: retroviral-like aspartic protease family protein [Steroidobacteraceae bacterium]|nr:retroviral-like aspartic protease family protein [Steroidobacteraceae bacterium]
MPNLRASPLRRRWWPAVCLQSMLLAGLGSAVAATAADAPKSLSAAEAAEQYKSLFACPTTLDHIGRVVAPVMIDGQGPFRFVVDTGASRSSIGPGLVQTLGLKLSKVPALQLEGITGSAPVAAVTIERLNAGNINIDHTPMPVLWEPVMAGADGILGIAGLSDQTLLVDFEHNRVVLGSALDPSVRFHYSRVRTQAVSGGLMTAVAYVGDVRVLAIIDTGSERTLGNPTLQRALGLRDDPGRAEPVTAVYGATEQVESGRVVHAPVIAIGPLRVEGVDLIYGDFHIFKLWKLDHVPAIILGMDVLGTVNALGFDFPHHALYVSSARATGDPFNHITSYSSSTAIH